MWRAHLKQNKREVIYFDAYAADYFDDPFVSFSGEILELIDRHFPEGKELAERREFKKTAVEIGKKLAGLSVKIGLRAATLGAIEATDFKDLEEAGKEIASGVSEIGAKVIEKKIENYAGEKDALKSFKKSLGAVAAKFKAENGFPLTIIVDELDRCRPDFALGLLERIKHLFDVEGVAFVLLVNREQIESYIQNIYGNKDTRDYLLKFGSLFIDLPGQEPLYSNYHSCGRDGYCVRLFHHYELGNRMAQRDVDLWGSCIGIFAAHFALTLREIEKAFAIMVLYYASLPTHYSNPLLTTLLSVLKVKCPDIYQRLSVGQIKADEFFDLTRFYQMNCRSSALNLEQAVDNLKYCLLMESEFKGLSDADRNRITHLGMYLGRSRSNIIPSICQQLDRFSLQPL